MKRVKKSRLNIRVPSDVLKWAKKHAKKEGSTVTKIIVDYLDTLKYFLVK